MCMCVSVCVESMCVGESVWNDFGLQVYIFLSSY